MNNSTWVLCGILAGFVVWSIDLEGRDHDFSLRLIPSRTHFAIKDFNHAIFEFLFPRT
jgi:hypothetical protein